MNTLNNIHALIDIDTEEAKAGIINLSRMMRYVLYESEAHLIPLGSEIDFTENYIRLMRMRYDEGVEIRFDHPAEVDERINIPPLLLIVFVENAFKHGISYRKRSFVHIVVELTADGRVRCRTRNSRHPQPKDHKPGIGLENVRKRLELIYDDDFTLRIDDSSADVYDIELLIPATHD